MGVLERHGWSDNDGRMMGKEPEPPDCKGLIKDESGGRGNRVRPNGTQSAPKEVEGTTVVVPPGTGKTNGGRHEFVTGIKPVSPYAVIPAGTGERGV